MLERLYFWRKPKVAKTFARILFYFFEFKRISAEVALGNFVGFRVRDYEIRLIVYRIVERDESRKSVKDTTRIFL